MTTARRPLGTGPSRASTAPPPARGATAAERAASAAGPAGPEPERPTGRRSLGDGPQPEELPEADGVDEGGRSGMS